MTNCAQLVHSDKIALNSASVEKVEMAVIRYLDDASANQGITVQCVIESVRLENGDKTVKSTVIVETVVSVTFLPEYVAVWPIGLVKNVNFHVRR